MHHRSPGLRPGKPKRGVVRSLPACIENSRNSPVTSVQTVCAPTSSSPVSQQPVRQNPVRGLFEQVLSCPPSTFRLSSIFLQDATALSLDQHCRDNIS